MSNFLKLSKGWIVSILVIIVLTLPIGASFYKFYYTRNYNYLVEAACDPKVEVCYSRDCTNLDDCPPNGFSIYKEYYVKAYDFEKCSDNSCARECAEGSIKCTPIPCGNSEEDVCTKLPK